MPNQFMRKVKTAWKDKTIRFNVLVKLGVTNILSDKMFLSLKYKNAFGRKLSLSNASSFNEKLQWLKLYDRRPEYTIMVDKYKVRGHIANMIGEQYLIPLIGVWDSPDEIDFDALPDQFALKCNHNSGTGMCICSDKAKLDISSVKKELRKGLKQNYYMRWREWPYKNVPRRILAEKYMKSDEGGLTDYKIHCFNGIPKIVLVCKDRFTEKGLTEDFFSADWEHLDIRRPKIPNARGHIEKPEELSQMLQLATTLACGIPFLRVDFYIIDHKIYFSELTFFPASGFEHFVPGKWDNTLGDWLQLPDKNSLTL